MIERVVERFVEINPAALLIAGDFLYSESPDPPEQVEEVLGLLAPIVQAGIPTFAVLGNHDYEVGAVPVTGRRHWCRLSPVKAPTISQPGRHSHPAGHREAA